MFPQAFVQKIKNTSMLELAKRYTELKKVGDGVWQGKCPHPNHNDSTPSFVVWEKQNSWCCMGCHNGKKDKKGEKNEKGGKNFGSDTIAFMQWIENLDWRAAVLRVAELNDIAKPNEANDKEYKSNAALAKKYAGDILNKDDALEYLYNRGLEKKDILFWGLGFDAYQNRIVFPLFDKYKNVLGFNRRLLHIPPGCGDKYKNSPNSKIFNKSNYLYGIHTIDPEFPYIRITEGCMDVILAHKFGLKNIVATLGTSFTEEHAKVIKKIGLTPVLIFDGDNAGEKALLKAMDYLNKEGVYCKIVRLPEGKDLADLSLEYKEFIEDYINTESMTYGYDKAKEVVNLYNKELYELKLKLMPKVKHIVESVPDTEKDIIKTFLHDEMRISL